MKLNDRHRRFVDEYLTNSMNGYLAYISVYGKKKNRNTAEVCALQLLRKPHIAEYVKKRQKELKEQTEVDFKWITEQHLNLYNLALIQQKQSVTGEVFSKPDLSNANKTLDQLSKLHGLYAPDKKEITGDLGIHIDIDLND